MLDDGRRSERVDVVDMPVGLSAKIYLPTWDLSLLTDVR